MEREVVHDVLAGAAPAVSVHVYSPPLTAMSYYDEDGRRLVEAPPTPCRPSSTPLLRRADPSGRSIDGRRRPPSPGRQAANLRSATDWSSPGV